MTTIYNTNSNRLTADQQRLINMYVNQYNQTNSHIDQLLDMLDEIRGNIVNVINISQPRNNRINRHTRNSNINLNRLINQGFNTRQNNLVHYDYDNPINPHVYNTNNTNRRNNGFNRNRNRNINQNQNVNTNQNPNQNTNTNDFYPFLRNFLNTIIVVRPTEVQIQNASRIIRYADVDNPLSETCPISLEHFDENDMVRQLLHCGHLFHQPQFEEWFNSNTRCPVCRYDIRTNNSVSQTTSGQGQTTTGQAHEQSTTRVTSVAEPNNDLDASSTILLDLFSNINGLGNNRTHISFDITDEQFEHDIIDRFSTNTFQSSQLPQTRRHNFDI